MERSSLFMALALGLNLLSMVEYTSMSNFVVPGALRGSASSTPTVSGAAAAAEPVVGAAAGGLRLVAAGLAISAACMSIKGSARSTRTQARAVGMKPQIFASALLNASKASDESLQVAKEVLDLKKQFDDEAALESFRLALYGGRPAMTKAQVTASRQAASELASLGTDKGFDAVMDKVYKPSKTPNARVVVDPVGHVKKMIPELESKTLPKFLDLLEKKRLIDQLPEVCRSYSSMLYKSQSVEPVLVRTAQPLSEAQTSTLEKKMQKKLGAESVKLITKVESKLIAGLRLEWDFKDPVNMEDPRQKEDISFQRAIERAVMQQTGQESLD